MHNRWSLITLEGEARTLRVVELLTSRALSWFFDDEYKQNREDVADMANWNIKS